MVRGTLTPLVVSVPTDTRPCPVCLVFDEFLGHCNRLPELNFDVPEYLTRKVFKMDMYKQKFFKIMKLTGGISNAS